MGNRQLAMGKNTLGYSLLLIAYCLCFVFCPLSFVLPHRGTVIAYIPYAEDT